MDKVISGVGKVVLGGGSITVEPRTWTVDLIEVHCPACRDPEPIYSAEIDKSQPKKHGGVITCPACRTVYYLKMSLNPVGLLSRPVAVGEEAEGSVAVGVGDQYGADTFYLSFKECPIHDGVEAEVGMEGFIAYYSCPQCAKENDGDGDNDYLTGVRIDADLFSFRRKEAA